MTTSMKHMQDTIISTFSNHSQVSNNHGKPPSNPAQSFHLPLSPSQQILTQPIDPRYHTEIMAHSSPGGMTP